MGKIFKAFRWASKCETFTKNTRGNVGVMFAVCATALGISAGAAVDTSRLVINDQKLQDGLDAAALYAAQLPSSSDIQQEGLAFLQKNTQSAEIQNLDVTFDRVDDQIVAVATADVSLVFGGFLGRPMSGVAADTTVNVEPRGKPCIIALNEDKSQGLLLNSGAVIKSESCEVHVHSTKKPSMTVNSGSVLNPSRTCVAGLDINNHSADSGLIETGCEVAGDPYAGEIQVPFSAVCDHKRGVHEGDIVNLNPGVYCGSQNFQGNNPVIRFRPGLYVIRDGDWNVNGGVVEALGVTFYFADRSRMQFNSRVSAQLTPPDSGPYENILFTEVPGLRKSQFIINDNRGFDFEGVVHLPSREIILNSGSTIRSRELEIIADSITINGAHLNIEPTVKSDEVVIASYLSR